jgi:hypothetical protein
MNAPGGGVVPEVPIPVVVVVVVVAPPAPPAPPTVAVAVLALVPLALVSVPVPLELVLVPLELVPVVSELAPLEVVFPPVVAPLVFDVVDPVPVPLILELSVPILPFAPTETFSGDGCSALQLTTKHTHSGERQQFENRDDRVPMNGLNDSGSDSRG